MPRGIDAGRLRGRDARALVLLTLAALAWAGCPSDAKIGSHGDTLPPPETHDALADTGGADGAAEVGLGDTVPESRGPDAPVGEIDTAGPDLFPDTGVDAGGMGACETDRDCRPGWTCRTAWNGIPNVAEAAFAHRCEPAPSGAAAMGEACDKEGLDAPPCQNPDACYDGVCSGHCLSDADCAGDAGQVCQTTGFRLDFEVDGQADALLDLGLCKTIAGSRLTCLAEADCPADESCVPYQTATLPAGTDFALTGRCGSVPGGAGTYPAACAPRGGRACESGLCMPYAGGGFCTELCRSHRDCPQQVEYSGRTWGSVCMAMPFADGGSLDPEWAVYTPVCFLDFGSSLTDCTATRQCASGERCAAYLIATGPEQPASVEYLCVAGVNPQGGELGAACAGPIDCASLMCLKPEGAATGECSALCVSDGDCTGSPGLVCHADVVLRRPDPQFSVRVERCRRPASCLVCRGADDCPGDYHCVRIASGEHRCAPACTESRECPAKDGGPYCVESVAIDGARPRTCLPNTCP